MSEMNPLTDRLRIKADVMESGEKIAWGSDTALMREAAAEIERLNQHAVDVYKLNRDTHLRMMHDMEWKDSEIERLKAELGTNQRYTLELEVHIGLQKATIAKQEAALRVALNQLENMTYTGPLHKAAITTIKEAL